MTLSNSNEDIIIYPLRKWGQNQFKNHIFHSIWGGFTQRTYSRIAKYAGGWLPTASGSLGYVENGIKILKENEKGKKENRSLGVITLIFPEVNDLKEEGAQRSLFSETINEVGSDLKRIDGMGNHVILGLMDQDLDRVIDLAKQFSKFIL